MSQRILLPLLALNIFVLAFVYFLQINQGLEPCPLCIVQRWLLSGCILLNALMLVHRSSCIAQWMYALMLSALVLFGLLVAGRHVWLQHQPISGLGCGLSLDQMLKVMPISEVTKTLFQGSASCQRAIPFWFGFSLAQWSLAYFLGLLGATCYRIYWLKSSFSTNSPNC